MEELENLKEYVDKYVTGIIRRQRKRRQELGITIKEMARLMEIPKSNLWRYETLKCKASLNLAVLYEKKLNRIEIIRGVIDRYAEKIQAKRNDE